MSIFYPQDAPHPFLPKLALATWRWFCLLVKWTGCHNFLRVLHLLPSHLGSHYSRFVLCYSTSASPSQGFCCVVFHDCYLCEPFKIILLGKCAVSWDGREWLSCFYSSWWHTGAPALFPVNAVYSGTDSIQPLALGSWGWWSSSQGSLVCWVCLSSVDVPVIAPGGQTGCLLLLWLPRKCSVNSTLFFLMCSTSLWSSVELSWRGEQNTGWVISQSFCSRCLAESAYLPFFPHGLFLPHLSSFFGLLFNKVLLIEGDLLAYFLPSVFYSVPWGLQLAVQGINWQVEMILRCFLMQHFYGSMT